MAGLERIDRIFALLEYLVANPDGRTLTQISADLGIPVSSAFDLLGAATQAGVVRVSSGKRYLLGERVVRLSLTVVDGLDVRRVSSPHLRALVEKVAEDVYLAMRVGNAVVYVDKYEGPQPVTIAIRLGQPRPLHSSAVGKLFTAFDPELERMLFAGGTLPRFTRYTITDPDRLRMEFENIRRRRVSISLEETLEGVVGIATPVYGPGEALVAAVHVSAVRQRTPESRIEQIILEMKKTSERISFDLGAGFSTQGHNASTRADPAADRGGRRAGVRPTSVR